MVHSIETEDEHPSLLAPLRRHYAAEATGTIHEREAARADLKARQEAHRISLPLDMFATKRELSIRQSFSCTGQGAAGKAEAELVASAAAAVALVPAASMTPATIPAIVPLVAPAAAATVHQCPLESVSKFGWRCDTAFIKRTGAPMYKHFRDVHFQTSPGQMDMPALNLAWIQFQVGSLPVFQRVAAAAPGAAL